MSDGAQPVKSLNIQRILIQPCFLIFFHQISSRASRRLSLLLPLDLEHLNDRKNVTIGYNYVSAESPFRRSHVENHQRTRSKSPQ